MKYSKVAITGSKGKTTVMYIINHVLRQLGYNTLTASSTEGIYYNETFIRDAAMEDYLDLKYDKEYDFFISEATSRLLKYDKYKLEHVDIAVFTNIEKHEHMETHRTFENYLQSKKKLFDLISNEDRVAIIDGEYYDRILWDYRGKSMILCEESEIINHSPGSLIFKLRHNDISVKIESQLTGMYNIKNISLAFLALTQLGISVIDIVKHIKTFKGVAGRFETIDLPNGNIAIVDYAHTPNSLLKLLQHIKLLYPDRYIVTIIGAGGQRSKSKRPIMGQVAVDNSDLVYLTEDNSRSESVHMILHDIKKGICSDDLDKVYIIVSRYNAIEIAIKTTKKNSIIVIAGKGSEKGITASRTTTEKDMMSDSEIIYKIINNK